MQVFQSRAQLFDIISSSLLNVSPLRLFLEILIQFATRCIFKNQVDLLVIPEESVHSQDVLMSEMRLNLDLSSQLMLHIALHQLLLVEHFERNNKLGLLFSCQVDMAKLSSAKRLPNFKIIDSPFFRVKLLRGGC